MVFVVDDLMAWMIGRLADAGGEKMATLVGGTKQERALRKAVTAAVRLTAKELCPGSDTQAARVAEIINQVLSAPAPHALPIGQQTVLEALQAEIARQLCVLDNKGITGTGQSAAEVLGVPPGLLAATLTRHLLQQIILRGAGGGPLAGLADQLNHDQTRLKLGELGDQIGKVQATLDEFLGRTGLGALPALIMVTGRRRDAEAALQAGYIEALSRWNEAGGHDAPEAWVTRIAIQRWLKMRRQQPSPLAVTMPPESTPEQAAEAHDVLGALAALAPDVRLAMVLSSVLGWSEEEIAEFLEVPSGTIGDRIFHGQVVLRARLGLHAPVHGPGEPLLPKPRPLAFPGVPGEDPLTAALVRTERWLRAGIEAEPGTASRIWAQASALDSDRQDGERPRAARKLSAWTHAIRLGKARTDAERSPR